MIRLTSRQRRRALAIGVGGLILAAAAALVLSAMRDSLVFFYSPSELAARAAAPGERLRVGGLVAEGSLVRGPEALTVRFTVTDTAHALPVVYTGLLPDLFREGQGVVALGALGLDGRFHATEILAKHDETYMPPEVAAALAEAGEWHGPAPRQGL